MRKTILTLVVMAICWVVSVGVTSNKVSATGRAKESSRNQVANIVGQQTKTGLLTMVSELLL